MAVPHPRSGVDSEVHARAAVDWAPPTQLLTALLQPGQALPDVVRNLLRSKVTMRMNRDCSAHSRSSFNSFNLSAMSVSKKLAVSLACSASRPAGMVAGGASSPV